MTEQPKTVVCPSCNAKFHVPEELIRGKLVKFRCRKCGSAIDVDGRRSARTAVAPPPPKAEITAVDAPATFSQQTLPPPRPPIALGRSSPNLHPWPEPPRSLSTTAAPLAFPSEPPPPHEDSGPRLEHVRDPSNRAPKIAAISLLLIAAGLSGFGLAMRSPTPRTAPAGESLGTEREGAQADPNLRTHTAGETKTDDPHRATRAPTRVTDLPVAVDGLPAGGAAEVKPSEAAPQKQEPTHQGANAAAGSTNPAEGTAIAGATEGPAPGTAGLIDPNAGHAPSTAANLAAPTAAHAPAAAAPQPAVGTPSPAPAAPPAPAARVEGDFNTQAAREAMEDAAGLASKCRNIDTPSGNARVAVTFAPTGHVASAVIESGPFVGTAAGNCVASKFRAAKVPPFSGESVTVRKSVPF